MRKNDAHREEAKNSGFPVRCRTSWVIFGKGPGKGRSGFALRRFFALDLRLCDSFPALALLHAAKTPDGWRRKTGGGVELAGSFSAGFG